MRIRLFSCEEWEEKFYGMMVVCIHIYLLGAGL